LEVLNITQTCSASSRLSEYIPDSLAELNVGADFTLILELSKQGWKFESGAPSRKQPPHKPGDAKIWYYHRQNKKGGINQKYLMVLAKSQMLFQQGLREIHHWQLKSYYATILTVAASDLPDIKPWQPLSYYKVFLQKYSKKRRGQKSSFFSAGDGDDGGQAK
jgi:hypothetical protein